MSDILRDEVRAAQIRSLVELVDYRAAVQSDHVVFRFINGDGAEDGFLTFAELQRQSRAIASHLSDHVVAGDRVLLLVPPGLNYVAAFFGCLYAGAIAVPAYPPNPRRADPRVARIAQDCGANVALAPAAFLARLDGWLSLTPELASLTWLDAGALAQDQASSWNTQRRDPEELAMLQYTSGSTGDPRGVMLSHANLLHNSAAIHRVSEHRAGDSGVFWLPPFHDMGLIGGILQPIYAGLSAGLMAPATFLQRPFRWLEAMSRNRATTSGAPNFAYDLCVERITSAERETLDLSAWRTSFNGAEPIRADTLARFADAFAISGLGRNVVMPCYGLAEATLMVSGGPPQAPMQQVLADRRRFESGELEVTADSSSAVMLVASGEPSAEQEILIVDPDTATACARDQIGEIWVRGANVASGYWGRAAESNATFRAHISGSPHGFLRTGDLGVLLERQLLVTGRLKDLVIIDGRNFYPHDIEVAAERSHANVRPGYSAAFSVTSAGRERMVLVAEVVRQHKADADAPLFQAIRTELANTVGIVPDEIVLVRQNSVPRTSSGKVQRRACRDAFLGGVLDVASRWIARRSDVVAPKDAITAFVLDWVREELQADPARLDPRTRLRDLGLDSLAAVRLTVALEGRFGTRIDPTQLWQQPDVGSFATYLASLGSVKQAPSVLPAAERPIYHANSGETSDVASWREYRALRTRLDALDAAAIPSPFFHVHEGVTGGHARIGGRRLVNFANYNYLGLSGDADVTRAAQAAVATWGSSVSASRVVSGERPIHRELEANLARVLGTDDAIVYIGGHPANVSTIAHLFGPDDVILCDALVHNSVAQGAEFSGARRLAFPHNDWRALSAMLGRVRNQHRRALIVIEGVYSADGDIPDLREFIAVKRKHNAMLMVDEAHSFGVIGERGFGIREHAAAAASDVDIWMGTLSKSLASCGGYIAGSSALVELLKFTSPGFVYSVGITPANAAAALAALLKMEREPQRVMQLRARSSLFLSLCQTAELNTGSSGGTAVIPVFVGDSLTAARLCARLFERGINVQPMVAPAVADDRARLRFFISCEHTEIEIRETVDILLSELRADAVDSVAHPRAGVHQVEIGA